MRQACQTFSVKGAPGAGYFTIQPGERPNFQTLLLRHLDAKQLQICFVSAVAWTALALGSPQGDAMQVRYSTPLTDPESLAMYSHISDFQPEIQVNQAGDDADVYQILCDTAPLDITCASYLGTKCVLSYASFLFCFRFRQI